MFRHKGKNRTLAHNLRLATLLSFIAGIVNITGVLSVKTLTTNVTGHFAFFAEQIMLEKYHLAFMFFLFTIFFLLGSFTSNFFTELTSKKQSKISHIVPLSLEIIILSSVAILGSNNGFESINGKFTAYAMLFAMGIQNSLVTKISSSTVRTTHLTGLFTDLGIELSQLFFYRKEEEIKKLKTSIYLRLSIITFFFIGCFFGGFFYSSLELKTLLIASFFLIIALFYDAVRLKFIIFKRKYF